MRSVVEIVEYFKSLESFCHCWSEYETAEAYITCNKLKLSEHPLD